MTSNEVYDCIDKIESFLKNSPRGSDAIRKHCLGYLVVLRQYIPQFVVDLPVKYEDNIPS